MVARIVRDDEVVGSNPTAPIFLIKKETGSIMLFFDLAGRPLVNATLADQGRL